MLLDKELDAKLGVDEKVLSHVIWVDGRTIRRRGFVVMLVSVSDGQKGLVEEAVEA